ncbi:MAG: hypothetical protein Q4G71_00775 [Pseudomonadota bacterium]|nr:hypothetical protein [Pseudomonadota bacterium]
MGRPDHGGGGCASQHLARLSGARPADGLLPAQPLWRLQRLPLPSEQGRPAAAEVREGPHGFSFQLMAAGRDGSNRPASAPGQLQLRLLRRVADQAAAPGHGVP